VPKVFNWIARDLLVVSFSLTAFAAVCFIKLRGKLSIEKMRLLKAVILLVLVFELFFYGWVFFTLHSPQQTFASKPYIDFLKQDKSLFRVMDYNLLLEQSIAERHGLQKINGYEFSVIIKEYVELTDLLKQHGKGYDIRELTVSNFQIEETPKPEILDMLNLKYVVTKKQIESPRFKLVFRDENALVYENKHVLPRVFAVQKAIVIADPAKRLDFIASPAFNPRNTVVIEKEIKGSLDNSIAYRKASIVSYTPNKIVVKADFQKPGFLALSETFYPGWKAFVNGKETELLRANHALRAVYLEKGEHTIEFVFSQENYLPGYIVSVASLIVVALALILLRKRFRTSSMS